MAGLKQQVFGVLGQAPALEKRKLHVLLIGRGPAAEGVVVGGRAAHGVKADNSAVVDGEDQGSGGGEGGLARKGDAHGGVAIADENGLLGQAQAGVGGEGAAHARFVIVDEGE